MQKARAALGSLIFLVIAPGVVAGLIPWWLTGWAKEEPLRSWMLVRTFGWLLVCLGALVLIQAFARFVREGVGTPAPVAPTKRLVVGGLYRYVRNARCMDVALEGRPAVWPVVLLRGFAARGGSGRLLRARDMRGMK